MSYLMLIILVIAVFQFLIYMSITNYTPGTDDTTVGNIYYKSRGKLEVIVVASGILNIVLILCLAAITPY